ncbi:pyrroline-5-carboxylate reductase [Flavobacterium okayamense]|uniref:Pyrroline-5-carboxylate reductase n=1 Tax=Flavobacterium okayamense TaxID=2830782 RepID=A0ABM7SA13_9FLAO|nr:pyrroline-5-carboxylate reductase [Flavobacterium okayamense]BCY29552.1 pyrroline-5-carboxylate reductase [Flavobacterium okayamense]
MKVLIIGFGNMGQTYANSFIGSGFVNSNDIFVLNRSEVEKTKRASIPKENFTIKSTQALFEVDIIILAVKPQDFMVMSHQIKPFLNEEHLFLSVMAGISIERIQNELNVEKVVRSMPNIPTQIGQGITVFSASQEIDRKELFIIQNLINTTGKSLYVSDEKMLNPATAISGSGPAYVYYFMDAMIKAAENLGFSNSEATFLVNNTYLGAVQLQSRSNLSHEDWINKVTSKGGTTEAALDVFANEKVFENIEKAIKEANKRAEDLGK